MQYALMFYENPSEFAKRADSPATEAYWGSWMAYSQAAREAGILQGGQALQSPDTSTAVRLKSGARNVQDGPIADTKEQLGGFFIIDVADLDAALDWAAKAPCAEHGGVEVRPVANGPSNSFMDPARQISEQAARRSYGRLVAWLSSRFRDISLAEDAVAEAFTIALAKWPETGIPDNPEAWLATVARREILRHKARSTKLDEAMPFLKMVSDERADRSTLDWPDQRLKLMFACTHPAVDVTMHTPLILQTVLGFNAAEIGSAFLVAPTSMGQRLVRLKKKIAGSGIAFSIPDTEDLGDRLEAVLDAIYAAFGLSWSDPASDTARDISEEAIWLAELVDKLLPDRAEVMGLQSLMLFADARRQARRSPEGAFVPLSEQDCELWDMQMIIEAEARLARAAALEPIGRYQLEAAIQGAHTGRVRFGNTDWPTIAGLYERLWQIHPTLSVFLGRAAAFAEVEGAKTGIALLDELPSDRVQAHQPYWATRADLLARSNQLQSAIEAYNRAIGLSEDPAIREFLQLRLARLL